MQKTPKGSRVNMQFFFIRIIFRKSFKRGVVICFKGRMGRIIMDYYRVGNAISFYRQRRIPNQSRQ